MWAGCSAPPTESSSPTPVPASTAALDQATPAADQTVVATPQESTEAEFQQVAALYEAKVPPADNGYSDLKPLLNGELPKGMGEDVTELALESPQERKAFDEKLLPILKAGFQKPEFSAEAKLEAGDSGVNYRGLRNLVMLVTERAEQHWEAGERAQAVDLAILPLQLASAMRRRPETASVNLFGSSYAETSLDLISPWLESGQLDPDLVTKLSQALQANAPDFRHIQQSVTVDFAQLLNSLETEEGRELLGIGQVESSTLATWRDQVLQIHQQAVKLYSEAPTDPGEFNKKVLEAAPPIQGVVIDYPQVATMQKQAYAKYKATQIGLKLAEGDWKELSKLDSDQILKATLSADPEVERTVQALLQVKVEPHAILVQGRSGQFELVTQDIPTFFEYHPSTKP